MQIFKLLLLPAILSLNLSAPCQQPTPTTTAELTLPNNPAPEPIPEPSPEPNPQAAIPNLQPRPIGPLTIHQKFVIYTHLAFGPPAVVEPAAQAAIFMAHPPRHYPHDWSAGAPAFGRLYGNYLAAHTARGTANFLTDVATHEDPRYFRCHCTNPAARTLHALAFVFVDRSDSGTPRPALGHFAGAAAGGFVGMAYLPDGFNDVTHAGQHATIQFASFGVRNILSEFAPEIAHSLHKLRFHNTFPEWWTREKPTQP